MTQVIQDASPLRIDSICVRDGNCCASEAASAAVVNLCVSLLDSEQPVHMTEVDVVRIRKRSRGLLSDAFNAVFSHSSNKSGGEKRKKI